MDWPSRAGTSKRQTAKRRRPDRPASRRGGHLPLQRASYVDRFVNDQPLGRPRRGRSAASRRVSVVKSESRASCPSLPRRRKAGGRGRRPVGLPGSHLTDRLEGRLCYRSPAISIGTSLDSRSGGASWTMLLTARGAAQGTGVPAALRRARRCASGREHLFAPIPRPTSEHPRRPASAQPGSAVRTLCWHAEMRRVLHDVDERGADWRAYVADL